MMQHNGSADLTFAKMFVLSNLILEKPRCAQMKFPSGQKVAEPHATVLVLIPEDLYVQVGAR